jgi:hypothetical protein
MQLTGRPPQRTPPQKATRATWIEEGPVTAGCRGACWRSPMIQQRIGERFGGYYKVFYLAQFSHLTPSGMTPTYFPRGILSGHSTTQQWYVVVT